MRDRMLHAPTWVLSVLSGSIFGAFMAVFAVLRDDSSWTWALVSGLLAGAFFGAVMGPIARRQNLRVLAAAGPVSGTVRQAAARAARRGPVPADPEVRSAALRLVDHQLTELRRRRTLTLVVFSVGTVLYVVLAVTATPWWWLAAALFGAMLLASVVLPHRLRRRGELLANGPAVE